MHIDEQKVDTLTKFTTRNGKVIKAVPSDRNMLKLDVNVNWENQVADKSERVEIYDFSNKDAFRNFIETTQINSDLDECFTNVDNDLNEECYEWVSKINTIIKTCFKKIRIKKKPAQNINMKHLFDQKENVIELLTKAEEVNDDSESSRINKELEEIILQISEACAEDNKRAISKLSSFVSDPTENFNQAKVWKVKKKLIPNNTAEPPSAKRDEYGNLITEKEQIKKLLVRNYQERLSPNQIEKESEELQELKECLFSLRYYSSKQKTTEDWTLSDLDKVLRSLQNGKSRDFFGHTY